MNFTPEQVDQIVERVVAQLGPGAVAPPATIARLDREGESASPSAVQIADQVITQALLTEAVRGAGQVRIGPRAILTPSARDFVQQRGIKIIRESASLKPATAMRWQVIATKSNSQIMAALASLPYQGVAYELRLSGLPADAAAQGISALCRGEAAQVVVFTDQPELVACLANRNDRVRAAAVPDVAAVERARVSMQPNLIVIDPQSRNAHEIKNLLNAFGAS